MSFDVTSHGWFFNNSMYIENMMAPARIQNYLLGLSGSYPRSENENVSDLLFDVSSCYMVRELTSGEHVCNCKMFHKSGYVCSHTLVTLNDRNLISLTDNATVICSTRRGKKRNRSKALIRDSYPQTVEVETIELVITQFTSIYFELYGPGITINFFPETGDWLALFTTVPNLNLQCMRGCDGCGNGRIHVFLTVDEIQRN